MSRFVFAGESDDYRRRREELLAAEIALKDQVERVAEMRRALPPGRRVPDYVFREGAPDLGQNDPVDVADVALADLFTDGHDTLIADFEPLDAYRLPLERLGYLFRSDNPERTKRYFRETPGQRRVHIHVRRAGSFSEQFALLFRDYVRMHPDVASQYAQLKIGLAQQYARVEDRVAYTEAKSPFIWKVIAQADEWAQQTGWLPGPSDV